MIVEPNTPSALYRPPAPVPLSPVGSLVRALLRRERDLLSLLPATAYQVDVEPLGRSRRHILLVNEPSLVREVLVDRVQEFPKNDLFVGALAPLVGNGVFISGSAEWQRQRRHIEPAFSHMHVRHAFPLMEAAWTESQDRLDRAAKNHETVLLDGEMSRLAADVICRAVFSTSLADEAAQSLFAAFGRFQTTVANVNVLRLLFGRAFAPVPQPSMATQAASDIRTQIERLLEPRLADRYGTPNQDIAGSLLAQRDGDGEPAFDRQQLVDQLSVFLLAGHETSASTLSWAVFLLSQEPTATADLLSEIADVVGDNPVSFEATKRLERTRSVIRETLRLYPPGPFLPRVAAADTSLRGHRLSRGAMVMISPWLIHRHEKLWQAPDRFNPARFRDGAEPAPEPGAYLPFGLGPRICVGAAFALTETVYLLASLLRRYRITPVDPGSIRPVARLTIGTAEPIRVAVELRSG